MKRVIGITVALRQEAFALFGRRGWTDTKGFLTKAERSGKNLVWMVVTGPGPERASLGLSHLLEYRPEMVLNFGVAGALVGGLETGHLVCPSLFKTDSEALGPSHQDKEFSKKIQRILKSAGINTKDAILFTSKNVAFTPSEKKTVHRTSLAHAVDMEAFYLAKGCADAEVPFSAVKAISDTVHHTVPETITKCVTENGRVNLPRLFFSLLLNPFLTKDLITIKRCFKTAVYRLELAKAVIGAHLEF